MRIGRNGERKADLPEDPTWDNWRRYVNKKNDGKKVIRVSYGPKS